MRDVDNESIFVGLIALSGAPGDSAYITGFSEALRGEEPDFDRYPDEDNCICYEYGRQVGIQERIRHDSDDRIRA